MQWQDYQLLLIFIICFYFDLNACLYWIVHCGLYSMITLMKSFKKSFACAAFMWRFFYVRWFKSQYGADDDNILNVWVSVVAVSRQCVRPPSHKSCWSARLSFVPALDEWFNRYFQTYLIYTLGFINFPGRKTSMTYGHSTC